ncbi:hypothetical protein ACWD5R_26755 [Streptomyces sp. NPDC002514]|uniref:hypothetical protein n=1 Tax=Streptomyces sp. NPDC001270 TaxID=3364554 RepID=UPI0036C15B1C
MSRPSTTARTPWRAAKVRLIGSTAVAAGVMTPAYADPANAEPAAAEALLKPVPNQA